MGICLDLNTNIAEQYKSLSQKVRIITEDWVGKNAYCPSCGNECLCRYPNNMPVGDFFCEICNEDFELKSKKDTFGVKIVNGAYKTMLSRITDIKNPNFFLLNYEFRSYKVLNFIVIPKHFFIPDIIEKRVPLSNSARRSGWLGCNILLNKIPEVGKIFLIKDKQVESKEKIRTIWKKALFLREEKKIESKGWILDVIRCVELIQKKRFTLVDVYKFESFLAQQHPRNKHIKDKIRQQLQILRDRNFIQFIGRGEYRLAEEEGKRN